MDPISALIGAGASLLGGFMNTTSQSSINEANRAQQFANLSGAYLPALRRNAEAAGFNPLAVLGQTTAGNPVHVGTDPGAGLVQAGKILADMKMPGADPQAELKETLLKAQINRENAETERTMIASRLALAQQPGRPDGTAASPFPHYSYYKDPDTGVVTKGLSPQFAQTQQGPLSLITGAEALPQLAGGWMKDVGKWAWSHMPTVRPDVVRRYQQPYSPEWTGGM